MNKALLDKTSTTFVLTAIAGAFLLSLACFSSVLAADVVADDLQPASVITYNENLVVNATGQFDSLRVGKQGTGGVTFFNGTIVNSTTGDNDSDNPVTFGDNVRIDGSLQRGEQGINDAKPVKIGDDFRVDGVIWGGPNKGNAADGQSLVYADSMRPAMDNINDFGSSGYRWKDGYYSGALTVGSIAASGTISGTLADGMVTSASIQDGTITGADIGRGTVRGSNIANDAVTSAEISDGTITGDDVDSTISLSIGDLTIGSGTTTSSILHGECTSAYNIAAGGTDSVTCSTPGVNTSSRIFVTCDVKPQLTIYDADPTTDSITIGLNNTNAVAGYSGTAVCDWLAVR